MLTYGRQCLDDDDRQAVAEVLASDWLTQGPMVGRFEQALCAVTGARSAAACSHGTAALHLAVRALGCAPGDVVLVPAITFLATANCCRYAGAEPFFVDIDDATLTIDPSEVEAQVLQLRRAGHRVRGVIGVDMAGHPCDWVTLRAVADRLDLWLVDDASHALGATYDGGISIGGGADADLTVFSFHPVKHVTTGEGGAVVGHRTDLVERARRLANHGTVKGVQAVAGWEGPWHSDMVELGYNYRLTDFQAALGVSQLGKLGRFIDRRREIASRYHRLFEEAPLLRRPSERAGTRHVYHLYVVRVPFGDGAVTRREFFDRCLARDVAPQVHYRPLAWNSYYRDRPGARAVVDRLPVSSRYYAECVSIPLHPGLTDDDVARVAEVVQEAVRR